MGFRKQLWVKFSKLPELYDITSEHTMIYFSTVPKTAKYGTETIFLAPKVWVLVSRKIKECSCLKLLNINQEMKTGLSMSVIQNVFATC